MIRAVSFVVVAAVLAIADAPAAEKVIVKNYATGASLSFPELKHAPAAMIAEEPDKPVEIQSGTIVAHNGKKFMCGVTTNNKRYVVALNACFDWQAVEPGADDPAWHGWETTYEEICHDNTPG